MIAHKLYQLDQRLRGKQDRARSRMCIRRRRKGGGKIRPVPGQGEQKTVLTTEKHPGLLLAPKDTADASRLPAGGTLLGQDRGTCSLKYNIWCDLFWG
jgi:hypothetical protein